MPEAAVIARPGVLKQAVTASPMGVLKQAVIASPMGVATSWRTECCSSVSRLLRRGAARNDSTLVIASPMGVESLIVIRGQ